MARHWREPLDPSRHKDWLGNRHIGGLERESPPDRLVPAFAYFVRECGTTLEFASLDQLQEALDWFRSPLRPTSREPGIELEHYWQRWFERLPAGLTREPNRLKMVAAMEAAIAEFERLKSV